MPIIILPIAMRSEFIPTVAAWYKKYWGPRFPDRTQKDWERTIICNENQLPFTIIAIDTDTNTPVGTATLKLRGMGDYKANLPWLSSLYVIPEYRGKKIATKLIQQIEIIAKSKFPEIYLYTKTDGLIYKKLDWIEIETVLIQDTSFRVMKKSLQVSNSNRFFSNTQRSDEARSPAKEGGMLLAKL
jgi:GNAT superfamily N-acetyltransferase